MNTICWMIVQRDLQTSAVQLLAESVRIRERFRAPAVSCPARSGNPAIMDMMPVHVDHSHAQWHLLCAELIHQSQVLLFIVLVIPAPPIPQGPSWNNRLLSAYCIESFHSWFVIKAVGEQVSIDTLFPMTAGSSRGDPAILIEQHSL